MKNTFSIALKCNTCSIAVITEYDEESGIAILYDYNPYLRNKRLLHRHHADLVTKSCIRKMAATERRLLDDPDPGDYVYFPNENKMENHIRIV